MDIALTNNLSSIKGDDLLVKKIGEDTISIFGSKKFVKFQKSFPHSLNGKDFILPTMHSKLRYDLEHTFRMIGLKYQLVAEVQDSSVKKALAMVRGGFSLSCELTVYSSTCSGWQSGFSALPPDKCFSEGRHAILQPQHIGAPRDRPIRLQSFSRAKLALMDRTPPEIEERVGPIGLCGIVQI